MSATPAAASPDAPGAAAEFTGERYLPTLTGLIRAEHVHRYALAADYARDRDVLDVACGEGYGCALLARRGGARSVVGVDIDADTVERASAMYAADAPRVTFREGRADAIPLPDASFDLVTSFETIEHHDRHEEMLAEIRRVLRPGGLLLLSSPNRRVYSDETGYENPFHVKELYRDELEALLGRHFAHARLYGQVAQVGSFLYPVDEAAARPAPDARGGATLYVERPDGAVSGADDDRAVRYYVAFCSDDPAALPPAAGAADSAYLYPGDDTLARQDAAYATLSDELARYRTDMPALEDAFRRLEDDYRGVAERSAAEAERLVAENARLAEALAEARARLERIEAHPAYRLLRGLRGGGGQG